MMNILFVCLLLRTLLSAEAYAASSSYRPTEQQDIDSTENLKARFQSPLVKKVLEILTTQGIDEKITPFIQAIHDLQSDEMKYQSLVQSENERELNEMRVLMAAYQSLSKEAKIQFWRGFLVLPVLIPILLLLFCCLCCRLTKL